MYVLKCKKNPMHLPGGKFVESGATCELTDDEADAVLGDKCLSISYEAGCFELDEVKSDKPAKAPKPAKAEGEGTKPKSE